MKRLFITVALVSLLAAAASAQTLTPPASRPAASVAAAAAGTGGTGAEGKVAILNTGAFRQGINELRLKLDGLNAEFEPKKKEYEALENAVNDLKNKIQTQGNTVSAAVRNGWVEDGTEKEKRLKRLGEDLQTLADKRLQDVSQPIYDKVAKVLESYCQQRGIVMVLDAGAAQQAGVLLFAQAATDITTDFMTEYNRINPAAAAPAPKK